MRYVKITILTILKRHARARRFGANFSEGGGQDIALRNQFLIFKVRQKGPIMVENPRDGSRVRGHLVWRSDQILGASEAVCP